MYIPSQFEESNIDILHSLMTTHPLATLVTMSTNGINANHVPLYLNKQAGHFGTLQGHIARNNPLWTDFVQEIEALTIFQGPSHYITPSWYPSKLEHGKVVPTWNYVTVHAYGTLRIIDDAVWIKSQLEALTAQQESFFKNPWAVSDAPVEFTDKMISSIVGIEILITQLKGKWKVSQNQPTINQAGVVQGLNALQTSEAITMAELVEKTSGEAP